MTASFHSVELYDDYGDINYDIAEAAENLARKENLYITSDRDLVEVYANDEKQVIAAKWDSWDGENYEFDLVVDKKNQNQGIGKAIILDSLSIPDEFLDENAEATMNLHVVSPVVKGILEKEGFVVASTLGKNNWVLKQEESGDLISAEKNPINKKDISEAITNSTSLFRDLENNINLGNSENLSEKINLSVQRVRDIEDSLPSAYMEFSDSIKDLEILNTKLIATNKSYTEALKYNNESLSAPGSENEIDNLVNDLEKLESSMIEKVGSAREKLEGFKVEVRTLHQNYSQEMTLG